MIGRPEISKTAPQYFAYINQAVGENPIAALNGQLEEAMALFSGISEETSLSRYTQAKWSIRQTLNHITDTERVFAFRALWLARGLEAPLPGYDQDVAVSNAGADGIPWSAHVEEFRRVRLSTLSLFSNMPPEAWMRGGIADGNSFTVRALAYIIAGHTVHHLALLRERYL
jgi:uncharacterized damage-inducible protein DinB